jgi:hypothetical protein
MADTAITCPFIQHLGIRTQFDCFDVAVRGNEPERFEEVCDLLT